MDFRSLLALALLTTTAAFAGPARVQVCRIEGPEPQVDGHLDEPCWRRAVPATGFSQQDPAPGQPATERTEVAFAYDENALYISARMFSNAPEEILANVSRRDNVGISERIIISLDTYRDRLTAYSFAVTATGVRADYYHASDSEQDRDYTWDPVWEAKTQINAEDWTAEIRIPFSQLRFTGTEEWGLNMNRWIPTRNEDVYWIYIDRDETGWSSRFGALVGMRDIPPDRRIELRPYLAGSADHESSWSYSERAGADLKMGVGSNLTLDATFSPDFGQVEADPAEVNLSAFETFFDEKRPFFIEGAQLLRGRGPSYFYSRRIGASPRGSKKRTEVPENTTIWGAAKLSGRLDSGLSIGAMGALTARERGVDELGQEVEVEPLGAQGVVRLQQEFGRGSTVGLMLTGLERNFESGSALRDSSAYALPQRAYTGGADWRLRFRRGQYVLTGHAGFSHLQGRPAAISKLQRSPAHYFQRPDAAHVEVDASRETLTGGALAAKIARAQGDHWLFTLGISSESPDFELNDLGRMRSSDNIDGICTLTWRENDPVGPLRRYSVIPAVESNWDFDLKHRLTQGRIRTEQTWRNFWTSTFILGARPGGENDRLTRGGPSIGLAPGLEIDVKLTTNPAQKVYFHSWSEYWRSEDEAYGCSGGGGLTWRLGDRWEAQLNPFAERMQDTRQYVATKAGGGAETFGKRYIFGTVVRTTLSFQSRLNFALTPDLTLEIYAEPFTTSGRYTEFGEVIKPGEWRLRHYGEDGTSIQRAEGVWEVDDGGDVFSFNADDFRIHSFRSNTVLRWEWRRGSTLFLVWQVDHHEEEDSGATIGPSTLFSGFDGSGHHYFGLKANIWWPVG